MTAFFLYLAEHRERFAGQGLKGPEASKAAGVEWKEMDANEKAPYEEQYKKAKAKFDKEMAA